MIGAVIFDLDGVLVDSESLWDQARREVVDETGGRWLPDATAAMLGMSSTEWSAFLHDRLGVPRPPEVINDTVVERVLAHYRERLPLVPGAVPAVRRMADHARLGLASSANRPVIDAALALAEVDHLFEVTVSSEEVARGKPAPDVYLEAARRMGVSPSVCAVIEDSANGIRSGLAAGMTVVAIPSPHFAPPPELLRSAAVVLSTIDDLTVEVLT